MISIERVSTRLPAFVSWVGTVLAFYFDQDHASVVVSQDIMIADAKKKLAQIPFCQDIFVTDKGTADEPLLGWVSNIRLGKYLEA